MALLPQAGFEPIGVDLPDVDISDTAAMSSWDWSRCDVIINAAAWTNVDGAETPEGRRLSWRANTVGPVNLARAKAAGDAAVSVCPRHYLVRTSWVVGDGKNFVKTMLSLVERGITPSVVADQTGRLTFASDLAAGIIHLLVSGAEFGTYNLSGEGPVVSWADVAKRVYERAGHSPDEVTPVSTEEYYAGQEGIAPRPLSSVLDLTKIKAAGFTPADSTERLDAYLRELM